MTDKHPWKMRYAPHVGLAAPDIPLFLHSAGSADPVAQIEWLGSQGFAGIEDNSLKVRPVETQIRMGEALARHGMQMGCFVNNPTAWDKPIWGSTTAEARDKWKRDLDETLEAAKRVNGKYVTVVTGRDITIPRGYQVAVMIENLKNASEIAEKAGFILCVETVSALRFGTMLLNHIDDAYAVVAAVDSPAVQLVFDIGHVAPMDGEVLNNLKACWDRTAIIQVADMPGRLELGSGELNWVNILRTIKGLGYTGLIELEHEVSQPGVPGEEMILSNLRAIDSAI
jgi:hydroxypyruvate isomerase